MTGNMKFLKERGFSDDQIGAALYEADGGDAIVEHIKGLEKIDVDVPVADLISFAPDYKSSGITASEYLEGAVGKLSSGASMNEVIPTNLQGAFMQARLDSHKTLTGQDPAQMRAIAYDDYEYGEAPSGATITLKDPLAAAQAAKTMQGSAGKFQISELRKFEDAAGYELGVTLGLDAEGNRKFAPEKAAEAMLAIKIGAAAQVEYNRLQTPEGGGLSESEAYVKALEFAEAEGKKAVTVPSNSTGNVIDFTGMNIQQITDAARNAVKGLNPKEPDDNKKIRQLLRLTMMELIEKFADENRTNPYDDAKREIELIRKSLI